jgi:hypothetical protein
MYKIILFTIILYKLNYRKAAKLFKNPFGGGRCKLSFPKFGTLPQSNNDSGHLPQGGQGAGGF